MSCSSDKKADKKTIQNLPDEKSWVIFNIQMSALYKVKYDEKNYELLVDTLNSKDYTSINIINRAQLIDDVSSFLMNFRFLNWFLNKIKAMDLAWTGQQDYGIAFDMINYLHQESEYIPWKSALDNLRLVNRLLIRSPVYGIFRAYIRHILKPIYSKLGGITKIADPDDFTAVKHQSMIGGW